MKYNVRLIEEKDNPIIEKIICEFLIECGIDSDKNLCRLSSVYSEPKTAYYVVEDSEGNIVGGCGISKIEGIENTCELNNMYCIESVRGTGVADKLLKCCLDFAKKYYNSVYLETLFNMERAMKFYEKHGFKKTTERLGNTKQYNCDVMYLLKFKTIGWKEEFIGELFGEIFVAVIFIGFGVLATLILPDNCVKELDADSLMLIGAGVFFGILIPLIIIVRLIFKRKEK